MHPFEIINFEVLGFHLQEPMAFVTNGFTFIFSFFAAYKLKNKIDSVSTLFYWFYLVLGISTFLGSLGHLFFQYSGLFGKIPSWTTAVLAALLGGLAMLEFKQDSSNKTISKTFLYVQSVVLLILSFVYMNFVFVAINAIITYLLYFGVLSFTGWKKGKEYLKSFWIGILILIPSAFIYLLNINLHKWFNRDDFSHLLMFGCIYFFYRGILAYQANRELEVKSLN
jgi:hypothetical protein